MLFKRQMDVLELLVQKTAKFQIANFKKKVLWCCPFAFQKGSIRASQAFLEIGLYFNLFSVFFDLANCIRTFKPEIK
jgi:hypothetical protein